MKYEVFHEIFNKICRGVGFLLILLEYHFNGKRIARGLFFTETLADWMRDSV